MHHSPLQLLSGAEIWLCITTLLYFLMNGAQVFETFVLIPKWTAAPPDSFHYFAGKYGLNLKTFWIALHSLHEVSFILAIIYCWQSTIKTPLVTLFIIHFLVRAWTILYFAPAIMQFQTIANSGQAIPFLMEKVKRWRSLNYIRVGLFVAVSLALIPLCLQVLHARYSAP